MMNDSILSQEGSTSKGKKKRKSSISMDDSILSQEGSASKAMKNKKNKKSLDESILSQESNNPKETVKMKKKKKSKGDQSLEDTADIDDNVTAGYSKSPKRKSQPNIALETPPPLKKQKKKKGKLDFDKGPESSTVVKSTSEPWSVEEELTLIDTVLSKVDPKDKASYRKTLKNIDWKEIASSNHSAEDCELKMEQLISSIQKIKSLATVLQEAKQNASDYDGRLKKILSAKLRFVAEFCKKNKDEEPALGLRNKGFKVWETLSKEQKKYYEMEYKKEVNRMKEAMDLPPDAPRTPFLVYYEREAEKVGSKSIELKAKCYQLFKEMAVEKRNKYVLESCKEWAHYIKEFKVYKESHPDFKNPMLKLKNVDVFKTYLEFLGMPEDKINVVQYYVSEMKRKGKGKVEGVDAKNQMVYFSSMFKQLSDNEQKKYRLKYKQAADSFDYKYISWKANVDEAVGVVADTYFLKLARVKVKHTFEHAVEVSLAKPKFKDEPEKPPANAFRIFSMKFEKRRKDKYASEKDMRDACSESWKKLDKDSKEKYEERYQEHRAAYRENVLSYVRNLGDVNNLYLGFKRDEFFKYFKEDIFEAEFPNEKYPVYIIQKKGAETLAQQGKSPSKAFQKIKDEVKINYESEEASSEDEESPDSPEPKDEIKSEEEEEEEEESDEDEEDDSVDLKPWQTPKHLAENGQQEDEDSEEDDDSSE